LPDGRPGFVFNLFAPFEADTGALTTTATDRLRELGEILKQYPTGTLVVQGHTALAGDEAGRLRISRERAQVVADFLVAEGYATAARIEIQARGALDPLASNDTWAGRQQNRRVIIILREPSAGAQSGEGFFTDGE
jgi:outer membrane protein OmpA-like peptidoglycan-associated protein